MTATRRLEIIETLGYKPDAEMIARENKIDEMGEQYRIRDEMIAEVAPMLDTLCSAVAGTFTVDECGVDAVDAQRWQDDRCYESASSKHVSVPIGNGAVCIACGDTTDHRTPAQIDADEQDADWQAQVSGMRS